MSDQTIRSRRQAAFSRHQSGLTLIELLVAALIGVIVIGAIGGVFLSVVQTNRSKMLIDNSTETLRYAHFVLANQIRNAEQIDVDGNDLVLTLQKNAQDCLGGTHSTSRFSFSNGSLRCSTSNPASPQEMVGGLTNVVFEYGCLLMSSNPPQEVRNADYAQADALCDGAHPIGPNITTVFVTLSVNPFSAEGGTPRSVSFAATARGVMAPRFTRINKVEADAEFELELFAVQGNTISKSNTVCEGAQATYKIRAITPDGIEIDASSLTGGHALKFEGQEGQYVPLEFGPINVHFTIDILDDHIKQGSRSFTVRLDDDEQFGSFDNITVVTTPVVTTINEGACEPDGGVGPLDTVTLKLMATDPAGNPLSPPNEHAGLEGQTLWFTVKAFAPDGSEVSVAAGSLVQINMSADAADAVIPVNPAPIGQPFDVRLLQDDLIEGNESFTLSIAGTAISGPIVEDQFEHVVASSNPAEHTVQVTILDVAPEAARYAAAGTQASSDDEIDVPWPASHANGDLAVLIVETSGHQTITTPPEGWMATLPPQADIPSTAGSTLHVYHRFATIDAANPAMPPAKVRLPGADHMVGRIFTFKGIDVETPVSGSPVVTTKTTPSTTVTNPSATVLAANSPVLLVATRPNRTADTNQFAVPVNANLTNLVEAGEAGTDIGNGGGFRLAVGTKVAPGATGVTIGTGPDTTNVTATIVLKPR